MSTDSPYGPWWDVDKWIFSQAAANGQLEVLQWLKSTGWLERNGCPGDEDTCARTAEAGHLDVLKWLRSNGCPWDEHTCASAAEAGHMHVLQWAIDNGCPWLDG